MKPHRKSSLLWIALALGLGGALPVGCGGSGVGDEPASRTQETQDKDEAEVRWLGPNRPIAGLRQRLVGEDGARAAVVLWSPPGPPPRRAVVFLHGWLPVPPGLYADWLRHLAARGNSVVYPVYQQGGEEPEALLGNALAGIEAGLHAVDADPEGLVAVGHTTGGALAFDYAAVAAEEGVAVPDAVLAVYPGRDPVGRRIPAADLTRISPRTLLAAIAGPGDPIADGDAQARSLLAAASRVPPARRRYLAAPRRADPLASDRVSRRALWAPLDRLIAAARSPSG